MAIGFDARSVDALVVHGYPFEGLTLDQCRAIEGAVARLGSGLVAAPHGDLSDGRALAKAGSDVVPFSFVVGALVARAGTAAQEDATTQSATVNELLSDKAAASFEAARPLLDPLLVAQGVTLPAPALVVVAAGPHASARLSGERGAALQKVRGDGDTEEVLQELSVHTHADPHAVKITLRGTFTLSARYR